MHSNIKDDVSLYRVAELDSLLPSLSVEQSEPFQLPEFVVPYYLEVFTDGRHVVTTDRTNKAIHLFNMAGVHLAKTGGEGRGPGEFEGSIRLHAGSDHFLYAYDSRLRRISQFELSSERISYVDSYTPHQETLSRLQNIYVTEWGRFGVYHKMLDIETGKEEFALYKLDDEFHQVELLLTMPGNEKMPLDDNGPFVQHIDHMAGEKTLWDLDGEWFYYISSHSPVIHTYNLKTGESKTDTYFDLEDRKVTEKSLSQLMVYSANMNERFPTVKEAMEKVKVLPIFEELVVFDNMLYLLLFDISDKEQTEIIRIDEQSGELHYVNIPQRMLRLQAGREVLYGIQTKESGSSSIRKVPITDSNTH